jgi:hypothetical protein
VLAWLSGTTVWVPTLVGSAVAAVVLVSLRGRVAGRETA